MKKINLKAGEIKGDSSSISGGGFGAILSAVFVLVLTAGLYGASYYLLKREQGKKRHLETEIVNIKNSLDRNQEFQKLYAFQERLFDLSEIFNVKIGQAEFLSRLSARTLDRNTVKDLNVNFKEGSRKIVLTEVVPDLSSLAEQIAAYNSLDREGQASLTDMKLQGDALESTISFNLKEREKQIGKTGDASAGK